ncbi:hypothetical protein [Streptomyces sp. NBC_01615]|uniref:hypothetical protein n=1 Tax=Streptomyces sp. NBC_01615 TaxID=2975898 RepID=UPI003870084B
MQRSSLWAKGDVGDWWLARVFGGHRPFRQVMGFNAEEAGRCLRDETVRTRTRLPRKKPELARDSGRRPLCDGCTVHS